MRHRGQIDVSNPTGTTVTGVTGVAHNISNLPELMASARPLPGKHRAAVSLPRIPVQSLPTHDMVVEARAPLRVVPDIPAEESVAASSTTVTRPAAPAVPIPDSARWRASHAPRVIAGILLAMAALGTSALGVRYAQSRTIDHFVPLAIGLAVVLVLWALVIASTPQVVSLRGSVLTVHNTGGSTRFDLADALQPVDVVGDPRTSRWAVLLHRPNNTTVVLRRNDVTAAELDPIVRQYRAIANQRYAEREARFNR